MSIQSTLTIDREDAIRRIQKITICVINKDYRILDEVSFEPDYDPKTFINEASDIDVKALSKWTCTMLEDQMDEPFYRYSMFDNYRVE